MKNLDKINGFALVCGQVASNPRVNERNRTEIAVFLCPTDERLSGVGVIQYLFAGNIPAVLVDGLRHPAALKADQLKKQRGITMHDFTRPVDVIYECAYKIAFLSDFFSQPLAPKSEPYLSGDGCQGLSLVLSEIKETLNQATTAILEQRRNNKGGLL